MPEVEAGALLQPGLLGPGAREVMEARVLHGLMVPLTPEAEAEVHIITSAQQEQAELAAAGMGPHQATAPLEQQILVAVQEAEVVLLLAADVRVLQAVLVSSLFVTKAPRKKALAAP